jgi:hypothetical protein
MCQSLIELVGKVAYQYWKNAPLSQLGCLMCWAINRHMPIKVNDVSPFTHIPVQQLRTCVPYKNMFYHEVIHLVLEAWWKLSAHSDVIHQVPQGDYLHHHSPPAQHTTEQEAKAQT